MQNFLTILVAGCIAAGAGAAHAEPIKPAVQAYAGAGVATVDYSGAGSKLSPKLFGGVDFGNKLALEAGAVDFRQGYGMYIAVKPTVPLTDKLSAYGKAGVAHSRRQVALPATPAVPAAPASRKTDTGAYGAFGMQYSITPNTALTAEYERYGKDKRAGAKADVWTLALKFLF